MKPNIFITGFSGTGKSTVGREVARRLGWSFVDTDEEIVRATGKPIEAIFAEDGEATFRKLEHERLAQVCQRERQVVSTGGGVVTRASNRALMERSGAIICLEASPETIYRRLMGPGSPSEPRRVRPLLRSPDPAVRIRELKARRQRYYSLAHWTVHTDHLSPQAVADEVLRAWRVLSAGQGGEGLEAEPSLAAVVKTPVGEYPVWVGWDLLGSLGERARRLVGPGAAYVISDQGAYQHARKAQTSLEAAGLPAHLFVIQSGERHKNLQTVRLLYDWLASRRAERGHLVVAVGGGVIGDTAGFVAATYLRGMPLVQVPTTLVAMMDAAIGGKVGVDVPQGKNLVGAFHHPRFVLADLQTLRTLPARELTAGWAEAIKHALIMGEEMLHTFEANVQNLRALEPESTAQIIRRSIAIKAAVVSQDERETLGIRTLLNYGHTLGHAIEAATDYQAYLHGEAVSIGMMGAAYISRQMGLLSKAEVDRQRSVLRGYGLPVSYAAIDKQKLDKAMRLDKKTEGQRLRWVLLDRIGHAVVCSDVPTEAVQHALEELEADSPEGQ